MQISYNQDPTQTFSIKDILSRRGKYKVRKDYDYLRVVHSEKGQIYHIDSIGAFVNNLDPVVDKEILARLNELGPFVETQEEIVVRF